METCYKLAVRHLLWDRVAETATDEQCDLFLWDRDMDTSYRLAVYLLIFERDIETYCTLALRPAIL